MKKGEGGWPVITNLKPRSEEKENGMERGSFGMANSNEESEVGYGYNVEDETVVRKRKRQEAPGAKSIIN